MVAAFLGRWVAAYLFDKTLRNVVGISTIMVLLSSCLHAKEIKTWGVEEPNGALLIEKHFTKTGPNWSKANDVFVYFIDCENSTIIDYISAENLFENGANATLIQGGPGHKYLHMFLESNSFVRGYDFVVQVYGTDETDDF